MFPPHSAYAVAARSAASLHSNSMSFSAGSATPMTAPSSDAATILVDVSALATCGIPSVTDHVAPMNRSQNLSAAWYAILVPGLFLHQRLQTFRTWAAVTSQFLRLPISSMIAQQTVRCVS